MWCMKFRKYPWRPACLSLAFTLSLAIRTLADALPITVEVDATDTQRNLLHVRQHVPAQPGKLTLLYPKWIPGNHRPSGLINDVAGLVVSANGHPLPWRRDADDMFIVHLDVPAGAKGVDVAFDFLLASGASSSVGVSTTPKLMVLNWNRVLFYPQTAAALKLPYTASLRLPPGWKYGTALATQNSSGDQIQFATASLEEVVDSPVIAGEFFREIPLTPNEQPAHFLDLVADSPGALAITPEQIRCFTRLVKEENAFFGAHHYRKYHFLLTLSDRLPGGGLEHHESSDNREGEDYLIDANAFTVASDLLPHEMIHSWNGKHRRSTGLATPDYQQPMEGELLWVYEGLTDYLAKVFGVRSGLQTNANFRQTLATTAAMLDHRAGRAWRPLADTAVCAQILYGTRGEPVARRRSTDFYNEGGLIWLEADTLIRLQTRGQKSLTDFCRKFFGGQNGVPRVVPYTYDDVLNALNDVTPYDWRGFFQARVYDVAPRAPLGGIENAGWRLAYTNQLPPLMKTHESQSKLTDLSYSLGAAFKSDGAVADVIPSLPADQAGLAPGMKLIAVNSRAWTPKLLRAAIVSAVTNPAPIELLVENSGYYRTLRVDYHAGEKYPVLERNPAKPDLLADILHPLTSAPLDSEGKK